MKPVYKCEYCDKMGDQATISIHESACNHNPENQTCYTCKHAIICDYDVECGKFAIGTGAKTCWEKGTPQRSCTIY